MLRLRLKHWSLSQLVAGFSLLFLWMAETGQVAAQSKAKPTAAITALVGATIYVSPTAPPIPDGVVLVQDSTIWRVGSRRQVSVPPGARVVNCRGLTLTAGFWNSHVHLMEPHWLQADSLPAAQLTRHFEQMLTRYGFTYAFDLATVNINPLLRLRGRINRGEILGPTLYLAGVPLTPASPFYVAPLLLPVVRTPAEAKAHVEAQLALGADGVKVWSASPTGKAIVPMPVPVLQAAVAAAHAHGKPVFAHPTDNAGVAAAIAGGVDVLAHVSAEDRQNWSAVTIEAMRAHNMALIPTLKLYQWDLQRTGHATENNPLLQTAIAQLRTYTAAGGQVLFGTDVGFVTDYSPAEEYVLMAEAGLSFPQILASLTTSPAQRFQPRRYNGQVVAGQTADLVLLAADPAKDIRNLARVAYTIRKGIIIYHNP